jgi:polar amino acid transport system substrate-binding protein
MAEGGGAPPAEATRRPKGVSSIIAIVVAVLTFVAGLGVGAFVLAPPAAAAVPPCAAPGTNVTSLLLGTNTPFPPFESRQGTPATLVGFDIDLIQTLVKRAGYACEWVDFRDFNALLAAVASGGVDIAISAITMNGDVGTARNATLKFTNPYFTSNQGVLKRTSDATRYCAASDCLASELNKTNLRIGVQELTTSFYWVDSNAKKASVTVKGNVADLLLALQQSNIDIIVIDKPAADGLAASNSQFTVAGTIRTNELYGFAVQKSDPKGLIPKLNTQLAAVKADGTYNALIKKWFG